MVNAILLLEETITGIRKKQFWEKKLILASGKLIFQLVQTIFSLHFTESPVSFFPSSGKVLFKEIVIFGFWKRILDLIVTSTSRKKAVNKIILFPIERNSDYQNEGFVNSSKRYVSTTWKSCFHRQEYLKKQEVNKLLPMKVYVRYWNKLVSISQEIRSHWLEWRIRLKTAFPQDEKKTGVTVWYLYKSLAKMSEKMIRVSTSQKIPFH